MARTPTTVRLSDAERDVLRAAARKTGAGYTTMMRRAALARAATLLSREVPELRRMQGREHDPRAGER